MIYIMFLFSMFTTFLSYKTSSLKLLSPTLWGSGFFMLFSLIWIFTYDSMKTDLSLHAVLLFSGVLLTTFAAEYISILCEKKRKQSKIKILSDRTTDIIVSKHRIYFISLVGIIVAYIEYQNISGALGVSLGDLSNNLEFIKLYRTSKSSLHDVRINGFIVSQMIYLMHIISYICLYVFLHTLINRQKTHIYMLLPLIPVFIMEVLSSNRSGFIFIFMAGIVSFFCVLAKNNRRFSLKIIIKLLATSLIFASVFFAYGNDRNLGNHESTPNLVRSAIQTYSCGAMVAFDTFLDSPWPESSLFGHMVFKRIYDIIGDIDNDDMPKRPFIPIGDPPLMSNIYTSLAAPIHEFGELGMLLLRFVETFISTRILMLFLNSRISSYRFYVMLYFVVGILVCYMYYPVEYLFGTYLYNPKDIIRYVFLGIAATYVINPRFQKQL